MKNRPLNEIAWAVCGPEYFSAEDIFITREAARNYLREIKQGEHDHRYLEIPNHIERCRLKRGDK